jgi:hypothetical protein
VWIRGSNPRLHCPRLPIVRSVNMDPDLGLNLDLLNTIIDTLDMIRLHHYLNSKCRLKEHLQIHDYLPQQWVLIPNVR